MPGLLLLLIIVVGVVIYVESCYRALPPEFQKIHPKLIWLLEVPVALALFQLPAISFLSNILIHLFIAVAIVLSFEQYFAARQVPSRLFVSFCAAVGVSATQIALLVIGILERVRPGMQPEVSADLLACILLASMAFSSIRFIAWLAG